MRSGLPGNGSDGDLATVTRCTPLSKDARARATSLREKAKTLPEPLDFDVGTASADLSMCVTCANDVTDSCTDGREHMASANKDYAKVKW